MQNGVFDSRIYSVDKSPLPRDYPLEKITPERGNTYAKCSNIRKVKI